MRGEERERVEVELWVVDAKAHLLKRLGVKKGSERWQFLKGERVLRIESRMIINTVHK